MLIIDWADCELGLEQAASPAWLFDGESLQMVWANDAALELWQATDHAELYARDIVANAPENILVRTRQVVARVLAGEHVREEWAFYPRGKPTMVILDLRRVTRPDGRFGVLNQALPLTESGLESLQRALAMFRHISVVSALVRPNGDIVAHNHSALLTFGDMRAWLPWFVEPSEAAAVLEAALRGERTRQLLRVSASGDRRWHRVDANALRDPISGELCVLVEHSDETARLDAEDLAEARGQRIDALNTTLELVERQRQEILALSAPIIDVGDQTLAVPIIGRLSNLQDELIHRLLETVAVRGARTVILDLTGVADGDFVGLEPLLRVVRALRLLGATPKVTGVRPQLALRLTQSNVDLRGIAPFRSLADGLRHE